MSDDMYSCSFLFDELGCCEIKGCNNKAAEVIDLIIPWEHRELGKWYLCSRCAGSVVNHSLELQEKRLDECNPSNSIETLNLVNGNDSN